MVRPITNWWPMIRIAWRTARRITGSPTRPTRRLKAPCASRRVSSARSTRWPVSISPQVEALTSTESERPMCRFQSASPSLSRISRSAVSSSGMRSSASATHISSTPSSLPRSYWRMKASIAPWSAARARTRRTRSVAVACTAARSAAPQPGRGWRAMASNACTCALSSSVQAAVIAARKASMWTGRAGEAGSGGVCMAAMAGVAVGPRAGNAPFSRPRIGAD